ncbi:MAG TPA: hypothetical protein VD968_15395 [Pyrinomonadaceae bacterium]|nr:hypothetical protein [Pyrinomonadaceae bacterium]
MTEDERRQRMDFIIEQQAQLAANQRRQRSVLRTTRTSGRRRQKA